MFSLQKLEETDISNDDSPLPFPTTLLNNRGVEYGVNGGF